MSEQHSDGAAGASRLPLIVAGGLLVTVLLCCGGLAMVVGGVGGGVAGAQEGAATGSQLRPDAPIPPQYLEWVLRAGATCPELGPAEIAAQIDLESSWNPNAVAHNPPERGGDAMGIAQFQAGTWATWGGDYDHDGQNSPYDPEDAIIAMGRLMCDNVAWAKQMLAAKPPRVQGDLLDLAWAAYFDGRGGILAAGGVPASGPAHDYPQQVRDRLAKYAVDTGGDGLPDGSGGIPAGWSPPTDAQQAAAVSFALAQLGKPYVFGAEGPDSYDCSGLVMAAWAHAGVHIPRVTGDQVHTGVGIYSLDAMQPGDLIFIPGAKPGTMTNPDHVGMYIGRGGDGQQYLVQAPHTGTVVQVTPVSNWSNQIAAIRRPLTH